MHETLHVSTLKLKIISGNKKILWGGAQPPLQTAPQGRGHWAFNPLQPTCTLRCLHVWQCSVCYLVAAWKIIHFRVHSHSLLMSLVMGAPPATPLWGHSPLEQKCTSGASSQRGGSSTPQLNFQPPPYFTSRAGKNGLKILDKNLKSPHFSTLMCFLVQFNTNHI